MFILTWLPICFDAIIFCRKPDKNKVLFLVLHYQKSFVNSDTLYWKFRTYFSHLKFRDILEATRNIHKNLFSNIAINSLKLVDILNNNVDWVRLELFIFSKCTCLWPININSKCVSSDRFSLNLFFVVDLADCWECGSDLDLLGTETRI